MKATGVVRKIDQLGRVVLPKEIRKCFNWKEDETSLEIYTDGDKVILGEYKPGCIFCGEIKGIKDFKGKNVCDKCAKELK